MSNEHEATIRELQISIMRLSEEKERLEKENKKLEYDVDTWVAAAERFSILSYKNKKENIDNIQRIYNAIRNEGINPKSHRKIMEKHRREWPTLWNAIDRLIEKAEECQN